VPLGGRDPFAVLGHQQLKRAQKLCLRQFWHGQPGRRPVEAGRVGLRPERHDRPARLPVGLHPLEDLLGVVEDRGGRVEGEWAVGLQPAVVPAAVGRPADGDHVIGEYLAEPRRGQNPLPLRGGDGIGAGAHLERDLSVRAGGHRWSFLLPGGAGAMMGWAPLPDPGEGTPGLAAPHFYLAARERRGQPGPLAWEPEPPQPPG